MAVAVVGAVSCTKDIARDNMSSAAEGVTLYASTPNENVSSKVGFEDNGTDGIAMSWESGDTFKLYNSNGELVDTFTTAGDGKFTSDTPTTKLVEGEKYTAKYNEDANLAEQNGDDIHNLNAACQMEAKFTYGNGNTLEFAHTKAIMTFTFKSEARPAYLVFENGEESYKVTYTNLSPDGGIYTSHIMINPCDATTRTLTFSLYATNDATVPYDVRSVESSIAYKKGYRYTAPISDLAMSNYWSDYAAKSFAVDGNISSAAELALLAKNVNNGTTYSRKTFTLTQDIDLSAHEWVAIGDEYKYFQGIFDGAGHKITGLYINKPEARKQALFGYTFYGTIKNLSVFGEVTGRYYIGGVVGYNGKKSTIINCYSNVKVIGKVGDTGGVAGYNNGTVTNCYSSGEVIGEKEVGGVVGYNHSENYYSGKVNNCYSSGVVSGTTNVGGVVGHNYSNCTVTNCYWNNTVNDSERHGIGEDNSTDSSVEGKSTAEMQSEDFKNTLNNNAYKYNNTDPAPGIAACSWEWTNGYPTLDFDGVPVKTKFSGGDGTESAPYKISSRADLDELSADVNGGTNYTGNYFVMTKDVELGGDSNEFTAIGSKEDFSGTFDGAGHTVSGLYINQPSKNYLGLFSSIKEATIKNLSVSGEVTGKQNVGGIVGYNSLSTVINCHSSVKVTGDDLVGGVAGHLYSGTITNCYSSGEVIGSDETSSDLDNSPQIGGVVGKSYGTVTNCYSNGELSGTGDKGGVVGLNYGTVTNCYWNKDNTTNSIGKGNSTDSSVKGKTTDEMQSEDFKNILNGNATTYNRENPTVKACTWGWESGKYPYHVFEN